MTRSPILLSYEETHYTSQGNISCKILNAYILSVYLHNGFPDLRGLVRLR